MKLTGYEYQNQIKTCNARMYLQVTLLPYSVPLSEKGSMIGRNKCCGDACMMTRTM